MMRGNGRGDGYWKGLVIGVYFWNNAERTVIIIIIIIFDTYVILMIRNQQFLYFKLSKESSFMSFAKLKRSRSWTLSFEITTY